jgi:hypothetical protein
MGEFMKLKNYQFIAIFCMVTGLYAHEVHMQRYENEVTDIQEIAGVTNYTLKLSCSQQNPIVAYVPKNFSESQDAAIHRYLLPNSTILENILNETASVCQNGTHVEVLLFGRLIAQSAGDNSAIFMITT